MMKNHHTLCLGLAALLVVPAVGGRGQEDLDLVGRLSRTIQAIGELAGIQRKLSTGDRTGVDNILAATEKAKLEPQQRDEYLARLRDDVSSLRMTYDKAVAADPSRAAQGLPSPTGGTRPGAFPIATTGLDLEARRALTGILGPLDRAGVSNTRRPTGNTPKRAAEKRNLELDPGFTADAVHQGRLLVRAGRYSEAAELLRPLTKDVGGRYWLGRAKAQLGFLSEAIELLTSVSNDPEAGSYASRATLDLRFLTVRRDLENRRVPKDSK